MRDSEQVFLGLLDQGTPNQGNYFVEIFKTDGGNVPERVYVNQHKKGAERHDKGDETLRRAVGEQV